MAWTEEDELALQALEEEELSSGRYFEPEEEIEEEERNEWFAADVIDLAQGGWNQGWSDFFGGIGIDSVGDWFQEGADEQQAELSQETVDAMSNLGFADDKEITAKGLAAIIIQSSGQLGTFIVPGTAIGKVVSLGTKAVSGLARAEKALKLARKAGKTKLIAPLEKSITKSQASIDKMSNALGYGSTSASQFYEQAADEVEERIAGTESSTLLKSDPYVQSLYQASLDSGLTPEEAIDTARQEYIDSKRIEAGSQNALLGFITGGALSPVYSGFVKGTAASSALGGIAKGGVTEAGQEFTQEGGGAAIVKNALPELAADINILDRAAVGAIAGFGAGGVLGGAGGAYAGRQEVLAKAAEEKRVVDAEAKARQDELSAVIEEQNRINAQYAAPGIINQQDIDANKVDVNAAGVSMMELLNKREESIRDTGLQAEFENRIEAAPGQLPIDMGTEPTVITGEAQTTQQPIIGEAQGDKGWFDQVDNTMPEVEFGNYNPNRSGVQNLGPKVPESTRNNTRLTNQQQKQVGPKNLQPGGTADTVASAKREVSKAKRDKKVSKAEDKIQQASDKRNDLVMDAKATQAEIDAASKAVEDAVRDAAIVDSENKVDQLEEEIEISEEEAVAKEEAKKEVVARLSVTPLAKKKSRKEWDAVAVELGLDPASYKNKDQVMEAVNAEIKANYEAPIVQAGDTVVYDGKEYTVMDADRKDGIAIQKTKIKKDKDLGIEVV